MTNMAAATAKNIFRTFDLRFFAKHCPGVIFNLEVFPAFLW